MKKWHIVVIILAGLIAFAWNSCSKSKEVAAKFVDTFHAQFNDSKFHEIYAAADPAFHSAVKEPQLLDLLQHLRTTLGAHKSSAPAGWGVNSGTNGTTVELHFDSTFEKGPGYEDFTFAVAGETARLLNYNVVSPLLKKEPAKTEPAKTESAPAANPAQ